MNHPRRRPGSPDDELNVGTCIAALLIGSALLALSLLLPEGWSLLLSAPGALLVMSVSLRLIG